MITIPSSDSKDFYREIKEVIDTEIDNKSYIQKLLFEYIDQPDRSNEAQEITENIYILATLGYAKYEGSSICSEGNSPSTTNDRVVWSEIYNNIVAFTKMNITNDHNYYYLIIEKLNYCNHSFL